MGETDFELMRRVQRGDAQAFESLVHRHDRTLVLHLRRYVGPEDLGDLRQEVLLRLWERAEQWEGRGSPLAWLLRVATNLALNHLRDRKATVSLDAPAEGGAEADEAPLVAEDLLAGASSDLGQCLEASRLLGLVDQLPEGQRTVLSLARLHSLKLHEIADQLDLPVGTVKSRLHAATQWLSARWEEEE